MIQKKMGKHWSKIYITVCHDKENNSYFPKLFTSKEDMERSNLIIEKEISVKVENLL